MSKLVKELAGLCYEVDKLYYQEKDKKQRTEIKKRFDKLSTLLEKAIRSQFDENEKYYKQVVRKIRKTNKEIEKLKTGLSRMTEVFSFLSKVLESVDGLVG